MKLKPAQLAHYIKNNALPAVFFFVGDEPLQMMESGDLLRRFTQQQGYDEHTILTVETGFDWQSLSHVGQHLSLFSQRRFIELRLGDKVPPDAGLKAIKTYLAAPAEDTVLLISLTKWDSKFSSRKWFNHLEQNSITVIMRPLPVEQFPAWIKQRLNSVHIQCNTESIAIISERAEGHLLACAQEIEKLQLLYGEGKISSEQVMESVADSARFEVFAWIDTVLTGNIKRSTRLFYALRAEGYDPVLILWALQREIRTLTQIAQGLKQGVNADQLCKKYYVWSSRKSRVLKAVKRYSPHQWQQYLQHALIIDRMIKGIEKGNPWDALLQLSLHVAGIHLFGEQVE